MSPWALVLGCSALAGCPAPAATPDAGSDASVDAATPDVGTDVGVDAPDAFIEADMGVDAANPCVAAGNVCITMMPLSCSLPDMPDPIHTCGAGQQCCIPAAGGPVACETAGGTCFMPMPLACGPGHRIGEPELYTCPSGQQCCLPLPPGP